MKILVKKSLITTLVICNIICASDPDPRMTIAKIIRTKRDGTDLDAAHTLTQLAQTSRASSAARSSSSSARADDANALQVLLTSNDYFFGQNGKTKNYHLALQYLRQIITNTDAHPQTRAWAHLNTGCILHLGGWGVIQDYKTALEQFELAINYSDAHSPSAANAHLGIAKIHFLFTKNFETASRHLALVIQNKDAHTTIRANAHAIMTEINQIQDKPAASSSSSSASSSSSSSSSSSCSSRASSARASSRKRPRSQNSTVNILASNMPFNSETFQVVAQNVRNRFGQAASLDTAFEIYQVAKRHDQKQYAQSAAYLIAQAYEHIGKNKQAIMLYRSVIADKDTSKRTKKHAQKHLDNLQDDSSSESELEEDESYTGESDVEDGETTPNKRQRQPHHQIRRHDARTTAQIQALMSA